MIKHHTNLLQDNNAFLPDSLIFLLGCQRSGTTWFANILDASPHTQLFMEPFSPRFGIFPEFPESSWFLEHPSPFLTQLLQRDMPTRLLRYKSFLLQRSKVAPRWFQLDLLLARLTRRTGRFAPCSLRERALRFQLLNLNRTETTYPLYPKAKDPSSWIIKELRLAGKVPLLLHAYPQAHFIVLVRHPCATVHSILNWFERGRLSELRQDLETYLDKIEVQTVSQPYRSLISSCSGKCLASTVALYWRISYETLFRQLAEHHRVQFVIYEQLASQPRESIEPVLQKADIEFSDSVSDYLCHSTDSNVRVTSALSTVRRSATYYRSWMDQISEATREAVLAIADDSFLMPYFEPYY